MTDISTKLANWIVTFVTTHRWKTILLSIAGVAAMASGFTKLAPSVSYEDMLGPSLPQLRDYKAIQEEFTRDDNLQVLIRVEEGDVFQKSVLQSVFTMTEELWRTPYSIRVDSLTNFQHSEASGDVVVIRDLVDRPESLDERRISKIREVAMSEPALFKRVVSEDAKLLSINVNFAFPNETSDEKIEAATFVREAIARARERNDDVSFFLSGLVALDETAAVVAQSEGAKFLVVTLCVVVLALGLILRAFWPVFALFWLLVMSIVSGMSIPGHMGWKLTPMLGSLPNVLIIMAVADGVHLLTMYMQNLTRGHDRVRAMKESLHVNLQPLTITSVTTAIGFLTLNLSASQSINALGTSVAVGVLAAYLLSIGFLPALTTLLPAKPSKQRVFPASYSERFVDFLDRHRASILAGLGFVAGGLILCIPLNEFNDQLPKYFDETLPYRRAQDVADAHFGGTYNLTYALSTDEDHGVGNPEFLEQTDRFVDWLRSQPEVTYATSITDTLKRLNKSMHGDDPAYYRLPKDKEATSQTLLLYEMSLPYGLDLSDRVNMNKSAVRVQANFRTLKTTEMLDEETKIVAWLERNLPDVAFTGAGVQLMFAHVFSKDVQSMIFGTTAALALISLLLIFMFRSFRIGVVSLIPNLLPALVGFGVWGLFVGEIGIGLAMVSGMTIGIVVDDTVHFLSKYLRARRDRGLSARDAVDFAYRTVGRSIVITTVVLVVGFLVLTQSTFTMNVQMGSMTAIVLSLALVFDLVLLPVVLLVLDSDRTGRSSREAPPKSAQDNADALVTPVRRSGTV